MIRFRSTCFVKMLRPGILWNTVSAFLIGPGMLRGSNITDDELSGRASASQLECWGDDPRPLSDSPQRSLGKSVHLNHQKASCKFLPAGNCC